MILNTEMILEKTGETGSTTQNVPVLAAKDLDNLQWAKEFMDRYERNNRILPRI